MNVNGGSQVENIQCECDFENGFPRRDLAWAGAEYRAQIASVLVRRLAAGDKVPSEHKDKVPSEVRNKVPREPREKG